MESKNEKRYIHFIVENNSHVYLKEKAILDIIKKYPNFEINSNNQLTFSDSLQAFINNNSDVQRMFIIINTTNIDVAIQKKLSYMIKDKSYQTISLPNNSKIVVTGNKDNIDKELLGLLVVIDD